MQEEPLLTAQGSGQRAACHFPLEGSIIRTGDAEATFDDGVVEMQEESLTNEDPSPGET